MNNTINNLLDFSRPNVGYEDSKGKNVCGCCGTYFVVSIGKVEEVREVVSDMYEALKAIGSDGKITAGFWKLRHKALVKVEGKETK